MTELKTVPRRAQVLFAAECAEKALPIFEREHPNDSRPSEAVEAAFQFALHRKTLSVNVVNAAVDAADDAADGAADGAAAYVAYAAAYVAYAIYFVDYAACAADAIYFAARATRINFNNLEQKVIGPNVDFNPRWKTSNTLGLAKQIWHSRQLGNLPILADTLMDEGVEENLVSYMIQEKEQTLADWFLWNLNLWE